MSPRRTKGRNLLTLAVIVYFVVVLVQTYFLFQMAPSVTAQSSTAANVAVFVEAPAPPVPSGGAFGGPTVPRVAQVIMSEIQPGHAIITISSMPADVQARINLSGVGIPVQEMLILPDANITDALIEITGLSSIGRIEGIDFVNLHTVRLPIPPSTYAPKIGEFVYEAFSVQYTGLEGKIRETLFAFNVSKSWVSANAIDPNSTALWRQSGEDQAWQRLGANMTDEDADYYYYIAASPGLSIFSIVATSPPLACSICVPGNWSDCIESEQSRIGQDCGTHNGYTCQPFVETRPCEVPAVPVPAPPPMPIGIIVLAIGLAICMFTIMSKRRRKR